MPSFVATLLLFVFLSSDLMAKSPCDGRHGWAWYAIERALRISCSEMKTADLQRVTTLNVGQHNGGLEITKENLWGLTNLESFGVEERSFVSYISENAFTQMPKLLHLELGVTTSSEVPAASINRITSLRSLRFFSSSNNKWKLKSTLLSNFPNLVDFSIQGVDVEIDADWLGHSADLESFEVEGRAIQSLPPKFFARFRKLKAIKFKHSDRLVLPANLFGEHSPTVERLDLDFDLSEIHVDTFQGLSGLRHLHLKCLCWRLRSHSFAGLDNLETLVFEPRSLFHIDEDTFAGLGRLEKLYLTSTYGGIATLRQKHLEGLDSLHVLHVKGPFAHDIESGAFAHMSKLKSLSISRSTLGPTLNAGAFAGLENLQQLHLHDNRIVHLPSGLLSGLINVNVIDLSNNQLDPLDDSAAIFPNHKMEVRIKGNAWTEEQIAIARRQLPNASIQ
jgi:Leucine-rich repeat (LRR) protein